MNKFDRDLIKDKNRLPTSNIDTTINELRFKKKGDGSVLRKYNILSADENEGVVERIIVDAIEDTRGRPITKASEIAGKCKVCEMTIRVGDEVDCEGRCGRRMDKECYQRQGSHVLYGMKLCRWDYWMTKLFWQWFSPSLKHQPQEKIAPEKNRGFLDYEKPRRIFK